MWAEIHPPLHLPTPVLFPTQEKLPSTPATNSQHHSRTCSSFPAGCPVWSSPPTPCSAPDCSASGRMWYQLGTSAGCTQGFDTCYMVWVLGDFNSIVGREDAPISCAHVVGLIPIVFCLHLHQQRIIHLQLQLVRVARHKPGQRGTSSWLASSAGGLTGTLLGHSPPTQAVPWEPRGPDTLNKALEEVWAQQAAASWHLMQGYPLLHHPSCSSEALTVLGGLAHAAAWANAAPGQGTSYRPQVCSPGLPTPETNWSLC